MGIALGNLEILDLVATGGMAEVYRARLGGRLYAIKRILPQFTREKELVQMFVDEARVAQLLKHPNVVRVFDLALGDGGEFFIVMEFADGRDLADVLYAAGLKGQRMPVGMAVNVAHEVLLALQYAHGARDRDGRPMNLIHRDISPHNVMVGFDGWVKLTDFGIAKVAHSGHQTMAGVVKGKFGYMSPEQARGKKLDGRSDLYNVGILLYEMITGERLFTGASDISTLDRMRAAEVPPLPPALRCPPDVESVIRRVLAKAPDERYPDAAAFDAALVAAAQKTGTMGSAADLGRLVRDLYGSTRTEPPARPSRPPVAVRSATAQTPQESDLLAPAPPPPPADPRAQKSMVIGGKGVMALGEGAPPRTTSKGSMPAVPAPVPAGPDPPDSTMMLDAGKGQVPQFAPEPPAAPRRTVSGARLQPVGGSGVLRTSLPQIASGAKPVTEDEASAEEFVQESTRFDSPNKASAGPPPGVVITGNRRAPGPAVVSPSGIMTKASLQPLPAPAGGGDRKRSLDMPPSTQEDSAAIVPQATGLKIGGTGVKALPGGPMPTSHKLVSLGAEGAPPPPVASAPPAAAPATPPAKRKAVVWSEPSLAEESARLAAPGAPAGTASAAGPATPRPAPANPFSGVDHSDPGAVTGEVSRPVAQETSLFRGPTGLAEPEDDAARRRREALERVKARKAAAAEAEEDATPAEPVEGPPGEDDAARRKREALERIKAKKAAKARAEAGEADPTEESAGAPPPDEDDAARRKREALERIKAKKAAKARAAAGEGESSDDAPSAGPPGEDEAARKKREALERIKAKKAARARGEAPGGEGGADVADRVLPPDEVQEWRTRPDAPPSAPQPDRAGKVLEQPLESYDKDARPLARRGAWVIGEPGISPAAQGLGRRRSLGRTILPATIRRRAVVAFAASAVAFYMLAARRPQELARVLGPLAPVLMANISRVTPPPPGTVAVVVRSGPPGGKIWLDGEQQPGTTPATFQLPFAAGEHKVMVARGKARKEVSVTVPEGAASVLASVPLQADGEVIVRGGKELEAFVDGQRVALEKDGRLPSIPRDRPYHLEVRAQDRVLVDQVLSPERPSRLALEPMVEPGDAEVVVVSHPVALVYLGTRWTGRTTGLEPLKLPAGKNTLRLEVPGSAISREVTVEATTRAPRRHYFELAP